MASTVDRPCSSAYLRTSWVIRMEQNFGPAHRAEVRGLGRLGGQRLVVVRARGVRVERQVELVGPAELEAGLGQRVVPLLRLRVPLGQVGGVCGDLVRDHADLHVVPVRQAEVLLGRDVAQHRGAGQRDLRRADGRRDVVVRGRDVGGQRTEGVERRLAAELLLQPHVLHDLVHRHVAGALDHHLHVVRAGDVRELAEGSQLGELRGVVGVRDRARPQPVAQRERDVVRPQDVAEFLEVRVEEALLVVREAPGGHDRAAAADDAGDPLGGQRHVAQQHAGVHGHVVDALFALLDARCRGRSPTTARSGSPSTFSSAW